MKVQKSYAMGGHMFWLPDGSTITSPSAGDTSRTLAPDRSEPTIVDLGIVDRIAVEALFTDHEIKAPSTGRYEIYDIFSSMNGLRLQFTLAELSAFTNAHIFNSAPPDGSDEYDPGSGVTESKGWLLIDQYDQENVERNNLDLYCHLRIQGSTPFEDAVTRVTLQATRLTSTLNKGKLLPSA